MHGERGSKAASEYPAPRHARFASAKNFILKLSITNGGRFLSVIALVAVTLGGCSKVSSLDKFLNQLHANVGKQKQPYPASWHRPKRVIGTAPLQNGNIEYRYRYHLTCTYVLAVNPTTNIIVAARVDGDGTDCISPS